MTVTAGHASVAARGAASGAVAEAVPAGPVPLGPGLHRSLVVATSLLVSVMAALDATIVTVALPHIQGSLAATADSVTWVVTMYTIGMAFATALTGRIADCFGRKRVMIAAVAGFTALSVLCGLATSLDEMLVLRFCQGLFAAPLIPLSQAVLVDAYPPDERTHGMAIWGVGVMAGPAVGPALGGWLTQTFEWRPIFFINLPVGIIALLLCVTVLRSTVRRRVFFDWTSIIALGIFVIGLQTFLDQGNDEDWFASRPLTLMLVAACVAGGVAVYRGIVDRNAIVDFTLFRDRNFAVGTLLVTCVGIIFFGVLVILPGYLENNLGWQVDTAGFVMGAFGVGGFLGASQTSRVSHLVGPRVTIFVGAGLLALGAWSASLLNLNAGPIQVAVPGLVMGFGLMLAFVTCAALAFSTVEASLRNQAVGLFNLVKTIGFSIGVTFVATLAYRGNQSNWAQYVGAVVPWNQAYIRFTASMEDATLEQTVAVVSEVFSEQMQMLTVAQSMEWLAVLAIVTMFVVFLARGGAPTGGGSGEGAAA